MRQEIEIPVFRQPAENIPTNRSFVLKILMLALNSFNMGNFYPKILYFRG